MEELPQLSKESIVLSIYKKGSETDCSNYRGTSLLSISHNILSSILLTTLSPCIDKITGYNQCGFEHNSSIADQIFYTCQILLKKWEYSETVCRLFIDFKKAYNAVMRKVLYSILIEFGVPMKLV
jgi:hypothetical protein